MFGQRYRSLLKCIYPAARNGTPQSKPLNEVSTSLRSRNAPILHDSEELLSMCGSIDMSVRRISSFEAVCPVYHRPTASHSTRLGPKLKRNLMQKPVAWISAQTPPLPAATFMTNSTSNFNTEHALLPLMKSRLNPITLNIHNRNVSTYQSNSTELNQFPIHNPNQRLNLNVFQKQQNFLNTLHNQIRTMATSATKSNAREAISIGLCQIDVGADKAINLESARTAVYKAHAEGARLILLPECFNCPYGNSFFNAYAETIPEAPCSDLEVLRRNEDAPTVAQASEWAKDLGVYLIAGSIPERDSDGKLYNTSMVFSPDGHLIAKHRKLHLFDIDIPGKITFIESETLSAGKAITTFELNPALIRSPVIKEQTDEETKQIGGVKVPATTPFTVGLGICYDMRFPEYAQICSNRNAKLLAYPGAFNTITGPAHWELLQRARAVDNQLFVATCSPARTTHEQGYKAWGHSTLVSPWAEVLATCDHTPAVVVAEADLTRVEEVRSQIPVRIQKQTSLYELVDKEKK